MSEGERIRQGSGVEGGREGCNKRDSSQWCSPMPLVPGACLRGQSVPFEHGICSSAAVRSQGAPTGTLSELMRARFRRSGGLALLLGLHSLQPIDQRSPVLDQLDEQSDRHGVGGELGGSRLYYYCLCAAGHTHHSAVALKLDHVFRGTAALFH